MADSTTTYSEFFSKWSHQKLTYDQISHQLTQAQFNDEQIAEMLALYKKKKLSDRTRKGLYMLGIGSFIGFVSCLFTVLGIAPEFRDFILYGLTTIGISVALVGGYYVFE